MPRVRGRGWHSACALTWNSEFRSHSIGEALPLSAPPRLVSCAIDREPLMVSTPMSQNSTNSDQDDKLPSPASARISKKQRMRRRSSRSTVRHPHLVRKLQDFVALNGALITFDAPRNIRLRLGDFRIVPTARRRRDGDDLRSGPGATQSTRRGQNDS